MIFWGGANFIGIPRNLGGLDGPAPAADPLRNLVGGGDGLVGSAGRRIAELLIVIHWFWFWCIKTCNWVTWSFGVMAGCKYLSPLTGGTLFTSSSCESEEMPVSVPDALTYLFGGKDWVLIRDRFMIMRHGGGQDPPKAHPYGHNSVDSKLRPLMDQRANHTVVQQNARVPWHLRIWIHRREILRPRSPNAFGQDRQKDPSMIAA